MAQSQTTLSHSALLTQAFSEAFTHFALPVHPNTLHTLIRYTALIQKWRQAFNLTASPRVEDWWVHLLDGLALAKSLSLLHVKHCADIGSGAGFPAIPCAIFLPYTSFTLCEIDHNKSAFLRQVVVELGLKNVRLMGDWRLAGAPFPCVSSKAYLSPEVFVSCLPQLVSVGGRGMIFSHQTAKSAVSDIPTRAPVAEDFLLKSTVYYGVSDLLTLSTQENRQNPIEALMGCRALSIYQR